MPLQPGNSPAAISSNISELTHHGSRPRSHAQIVAIALANADRTKRADGGEAVPVLPTPAPKSPADSLTEKIKRIEDLHRENTEDPFPSFQRIIQNKADGGAMTPRKAQNRLARVDHRIEAALRIARAAGGGTGFSSSDVPYFERQEIGNVNRQPYGFSAGVGGGRTDKNNLSVNPGSYVLASDVVAGLGDGNSLAGAHVFNQIMNSMPWAVTPPRSAGHRGPPPPPHDAELAQGVTPTAQREPITPTLADGGEAPKVPIKSADGEILLSDEDVLRIGQFYSPQRDIDRYPATHDKMMRRAHQLLDHFQKVIRGKTIRHLKGLRGPVGSRDANKGHV
jgi:hypothetical protein